jgi:hypothetical protein
MFKKIKFLLILVGLSALVAGLCACNETKIDEYQQQGYTISVTYDSNGGAFLGRSGVTIVDMFNPQDYTQDSSGKVHIKLLEPTDTSRPSSGSANVTLAKSQNFLAGWYKTRNVAVNSAGNPVDEDGVEITERDGVYYYSNGQSATPAYTYADLWDFSTDTIDYAESDGIVSLTLYAGWVPYYEFEYYYQKDGQWVNYGSTVFDWKSATDETSYDYEGDTVWIPTWNNGAMNYKHIYGTKTFTFPSIDGKTFSKAYADEACTQEITSSIKHNGSLDVATGTAINRIQNIYVTFEEGEIFRIETAAQFAANAKTSGIYQILADLDFDNGNVAWPTAIGTGTFTGKMYSVGGSFKISNVLATHSNGSSKVGGLFGSIASGAEISNLTFENLTFDLAYTGRRLNETNYGLFAGLIDDNATISNVTISGATFKIGAISLGNDRNINLIANGNTAGITCGTVKLTVYGTFLTSDSYNYTINLNTIQVDENGNVQLELVSTNRQPQSSYDINYLEANNE